MNKRVQAVRNEPAAEKIKLVTMIKKAKVFD